MTETTLLQGGENEGFWTLLTCHDFVGVSVVVVSTIVQTDFVLDLDMTDI